MKRIAVFALVGILAVGSVSTYCLTRPVSRTQTIISMEDYYAEDDGDIELIPLDQESTESNSSNESTESNSSENTSSSTEESTSEDESASEKSNSSKESSTSEATLTQESDQKIVLEFNEDGVTNQRSTDSSNTSSTEEEQSGDPILFEEEDNEDDGELVEDLTLENDKPKEESKSDTDDKEVLDSLGIEGEDGITTYSEPEEEKRDVTQMTDTTYTVEQARVIMQDALSNALCITTVTDSYKVDFINNKKVTGYIIKAGNSKVGVYNVGKYMYLDDMVISNGKATHSMIAAKITTDLYNTSSGILYVGDSTPVPGNIQSLDSQQKVTENGKTYDVLDVTMTNGNGKMYLLNGKFKKLIVNGEKTIYFDKTFPINLQYETSKGYLKNVNVASENQMKNEYKTSLTSGAFAAVLTSLGVSMNFDTENNAESSLLNMFTNSSDSASTDSTNTSTANSDNSEALLGLLGGLFGLASNSSSNSSNGNSGVVNQESVNSSSTETSTDSSASESSDSSAEGSTLNRTSFNPDTDKLEIGEEYYYKDADGKIHHYIGTSNGNIELSDGIDTFSEDNSSDKSASSTSSTSSTEETSNNSGDYMSQLEDKSNASSSTSSSVESNDSSSTSSTEESND